MSGSVSCEEEYWYCTNGGFMKCDTVLIHCFISICIVLARMDYGKWTRKAKVK